MRREVEVPTPLAMKNHIALAAASLLLFACSGSFDGTTQPGAENPSLETKGRSDGRIALLIDGQEYFTQGGVKDGGLHFKNKLFLGMSGSQEKTDGVPTKELWLTLQKRDFESGTFSFLSRERTMRDEPENTGVYVSIQFDGADSQITSKEGNITFAELETESSSTRTNILVAKGSLKGTFRGPQGKVLEVSGSFEYYDD